jgi:DNA-binding MarR family transcriptional regulator
MVAKDSKWLTAEEQHAWHGFQRMQMQLNAALSRQLSRDSGLSGADYGVLVALSDRDDRTMRPFELAIELGWEKSRLSHHLARMAKRGLIELADCPEDGRGSFVVLSDRGLAVLREAAPDHVTAVRELCIDLLTKEQLSQLAAIADTVLAHLVVDGEHAVS